MTEKKTDAGFAQRRLLKLFLVLSPHTVGGLRLIDIARALEENSPTCLRDLKVLEQEGFTERVRDQPENWRLGPRLVQIATAFTQDIRRARGGIDELEQRYTRNPN